MRFTGFRTPLVTDFRATDVEGIGSPRWGSDVATNKRYRWVKNSTGGALTVGGWYTYGTLSAGGYFTEVYKFGQSSAGTSIHGRPVLAVSAIPDGQYGWVQEAGEGSGQIGGATGSNVAAYGNLLPVSGQIYLSLDTAAGTAATANERPIALAAGNSNATNVNVLLRSPV